MRLLKILAVLIVLAGGGLVGFAYFGNLSPEKLPVSQPIELNAQ